jgi:predicted DNA-binding transcriptional regulator YafY
MFAIDRILSMTVTNLPCQIPLGFNIDEYVRDALSVMRGGPQIDVELLFDRKTSAWAKDRIWHPSQKAMLDKRGCLTLVLQAADNPELVGWIFSFGMGVRVIKPETLRQQVKSIANCIANQE